MLVSNIFSKIKTNLFGQIQELPTIAPMPEQTNKPYIVLNKFAEYDIEAGEYVQKNINNFNLNTYEKCLSYVNIVIQ